MQRFAGKTAIVTGASSGIGKAVMVRLAAEGARVFAFDIDAGQLDAAIGEVTGEASPVLCDVSDEGRVAAAVAEVLKAAGRIDVLVSNAGIGGGQTPLHETSLDTYERVMAVNARGTFLMMRAVIPAMLAQGGGAIVNMASIGAFRATPNSIAYLASKGAQMMMTRTAAVEYAERNIRVNAVCPSATATSILDNASDEMIERLAARHPQKRLGTPEEVAALVAFLASDEAPHITGAGYVIDGGRSAT